MPEFETTAQGCRVATLVGGVLTGWGADISIIDDPLKPKEALSQAQRQAANEWYAVLSVEVVSLPCAPDADNRPNACSWDGRAQRR